MTYKERMEQYIKARAAVQDVEKLYNHYDSDLGEIINRHKWKEDAAKIEATRAKRDAEKNKLPALKLRAAVLRDNARRALLEEVTPAAVAVFRRYQGKPYGEKTRRKIADEIREKTGFYAYISNSGSHSTLDLYQADGYTWSRDELQQNLYHNNGNDGRGLQPFLQDNKINMGSADALRAYNLRPYIENPDEHAEQIRAAHVAACAAFEKWEATARAYNDLLPNGAREIDTRAGKPYGII